MTSTNHIDVIKTMFKGALYKWSYLYSSNFLSTPYSKLVHSNLPIDELTQDALSRLYPNKTYQNLVSCKWYGFEYKVGVYIYASSNSNNHTFYFVNNIFFTGDSIALNCSTTDFQYIPSKHVFIKLISKKTSHQWVDASDVWINPIESYNIEGEVYILPEFRYFE